jgi:8-oxo-dGTP diphosphatase
MANRNKAVLAVYLIVEREEKLLIARRCNTGYEDGNYQVPAGHVDPGELPKASMVREAKEEIGITIDPVDLELVHTSYRPPHDETGNRVDLFFRAHRWSGEITNAEPHKCDELRWVGYDELPDNMTPHVRHAIDCIQQDIIYSELGIEFLKKHGRYMLDG